MKPFMQAWRVLIAFLLTIPGIRFFIRRSRLAVDAEYRIEMTDDVPDKLRAGTLYVIREHGLQMQVSMLCPEGCGTVINLNLMQDDHPFWRLSVDAAGKPTLHPSVWRREGCFAHYFVRGGRIEWCR